jgi:hypothetical protein
MLVGIVPGTCGLGHAQLTNMTHERESLQVRGAAADREEGCGYTGGELLFSVRPSSLRPIRTLGATDMMRGGVGQS